MSELSDSELLEALERNGIATSNIKDRETALAMLNQCVPQNKSVPNTDDVNSSGCVTRSQSRNLVNRTNELSEMSVPKNKSISNTDDVNSGGCAERRQFRDLTNTTGATCSNGEQNHNIEDDSEEELLRLEAEIQRKLRIIELRAELESLNAQSVQVPTINPINENVHIPPAAHTTNHFAASNQDIENAVTIFSGDDSHQIGAFVKEIESAAQQFGWTPIQTSIYAKRFVSGTAKTFLRTVKAHTWPEIRQLLEEEFASNLSTAALHKMLAGRRRADGETTQQYTVAMRAIAALGEIEERDLISYVIDGVARNQMERLFLSGASTFAELRVILSRFEETSVQQQSSNQTRWRSETIRQQSGQRSDPTPMHSTNNNNNAFRTNVYQKRFEQNRTSQIDDAPRRPPLRCYNCNGVGHFASACLHQRQNTPTCLKCGAKGHLQWQCTGESIARNTEVSNIDTVQRETHTFREPVSLLMSNISSSVNLKITALLDTGSPISFIQSKYVPQVFFDSLVKGPNVQFTGLNGSRMDTICFIVVTVLFKNRPPSNIKMAIVRDGTMHNAAVLGRDFMEKLNLRLTSKVESSFEENRDNNSSCLMNPALLETLSIEMNDTFEFEINPQFEKSHREFIVNLIEGSKMSEPTKSVSNEIEFTIRLTKETPFFSAPYRLSYSEKEKVKVIIDDLLKHKIIRPSHSPYTSPIVLVKKKCGAVRMCVDYRNLNKITERDNYPLPLIEDQIDALQNKRFFSCLDLKDSFYHVPVSIDSIKYTSFVTPLGQFEFTRMPFGARNASSVFQRYINTLFRSLVDSNKILIYMDDIMVATTTLEEHLGILSEVFSIIGKHSLKLKLAKCRFLFNEINYLGYSIKDSQIRPNPTNIEAIENFPEPKCTREVHSFLGLASYFRKFINSFATIAKPLYDLIRKDVDFQFNDQARSAFSHIKSLLLSTPVLSLYSPIATTELHCDASSHGYGAILMQKDKDNKWHPVFYFSKRTTDTESRYHSFELETLAIVNAVKRFRIYLEGRPFTIITDCAALTLTLSKKHINPRIARWALELSNYDFKMIHRGNSQMRHVDALSRNYEVLVVEPITVEQTLAVEQGRDEGLTKLRIRLEEEQCEKFELKDGLVYKRASGGKLLFYVPTCLEDNVIRSCHDEMGHFGVDKVHNQITKFYWFPNMKTKIQNHIRKCLKCIQFSPNSGKVEGELHSIPKGKLPFDTLHIDHLGPMETTKKKNRHILIVVDAFTKYLRLYAVKTTSSKDSIKCLQSYFSSFSRPLRIVSDRGTSFTSEEFSSFLRDHNINQCKIATASPQSNGQAERINRVIIPILSKICSNSDWDTKLGEVEFYINNTICRSTGVSPCKLLFGVEQRGIVNDNIKEFFDANNDETRNLDSIREKAAAKTEAVQNKNKAYYDGRHKPPNKYNMDDLVMVTNFDTTPGINKKLLPKFRGPYRVSQVLPNDRYQIEDVDNWQVTQRAYRGIHAPAQLRPYITNSNGDSIL